MPDYSHDYFSNLFNLDKYYTRRNAGLLPAYRTHTDGTAIPLQHKGGAPVMEPAVSGTGESYDPEMREIMSYAPLLFSDQELPPLLDSIRKKFRATEGGRLYNKPAKTKLWAAIKFLQEGAVEGYSENVLGDMSRSGWTRPKLEAAAEVQEPWYRKLPERLTEADVLTDLSTLMGGAGTPKLLDQASMALGPITMATESLGSAYRRHKDSANMENAVREVEPAQYTGALQKRIGDWVRGTKGKDIHDAPMLNQIAGNAAQITSGGLRPVTDIYHSIRHGGKGGAVGGLAGGAALIGNIYRAGLSGSMLPYYATAGMGQEAAELIADSAGTTAQIHNNARFNDGRLGHRLNMYDRTRGRNPKETVAQRAAQGNYQARNLQDYYAKGWGNRPFNEAIQSHVNQSSTKTRPFKEGFLDWIDPKERAKDIGKWWKRR